jgi:hypothetical protein
MCPVVSLGSFTVFRFDFFGCHRHLRGGA